MSDWSPPDSDFDTNMGEGIALGGGRVSPGTQAARDRAAAVLRTTFEDNSGLGDTVDRQVAKVAGRKTFAPPAQDFAFTPPPSDFQAPAEKSETGPSLVDQILAPWKGETVASLAKQNAFVRLTDYGTKIMELQKQTIAEHPDMGPLEIASLARAQYKDQYGHAPELDINWSELPHQIYQQITDQPAAFVSNLFKSLVVDPEMLLLGTTGLPAKLAQAGSKVGAAAARAGEVGAQMGAQSAGISAAEQLQKTGEVQAQPTAQAAAQGAGMGLALGALHSAVSVGLRAIGKEKSAPVTPEVEQEFAKRFDADVQEGMPASQAMAKNMRDAGMDHKEADAMGAAVQRADRAMDEVLRSMEPEGAAPTDLTKREFREGAPAELMSTTDAVGAAVEKVGADEFQRIVEEQLKQFPADEKMSAADKAWLTAIKVENVARNIVDERRVDAKTRARVDQMSPDEMRKALFTDDLTGLPNRRAYAEADKQPITASIDVDGLKWINDNLGHEAGDQLIRQVADALKDHDAYHLSGDEFVAQFPDRDSARAAMAAFQDTLAKSKFEFVTPKGEHIIIDGPGATHGIGDTHSAADAALREGKLSKELSGERAARGEEPPRLQRVEPEAISAAGERAPAGDQVQTPAFNLADIKPEIGWAETGGRMIRDPVTGDVTGRTKWIPRSEFWQERPVKISERDAHVAIDKAEAGKKLTPNEQKFVDYTRETLQKRYDELPEAVREAHEERLAIQQYGRIDPRLLASIGLAGLGAAGVYALTQDPTKTIATAVAAGALPFARRVMTRLTNGVAGISERYAGDTRYNTKDIYRKYTAERDIVPKQIDAWADALKTVRGDPGGAKAALEAVTMPSRRYAREQRNIVLRDALQGFEDAKAQLTPDERSVNEQVRQMQDRSFAIGERLGVLRDYLENYLPGIYKKPLSMSWDQVIDWMTQEGRRGAGAMSSRTRHSLQKIFPDYRTVDQMREQGKINLTPLTNDPIEMTRLSAKAIAKAVANKKLIETLKREPGPAMRENGTPIPLMVPITTDGAAKRIVQGNAILADKFGIDDPDAVRAANKFDILRAPKDYVYIKHPALEGYRVHKDIAEPMKLLFDTSDPNVIMRGAHALSMAAKSIMFMFSPAFHMMNLTQVALPYSMRHPSFALNTARAGKALVSKTFMPEMEDAMSHGMKIAHGPEDVNPDMAQKFLDWARTSMGDATSGLGRIGEIPPAALQELHKGFNWMLWGVTQPALKIGMWMTEVPAAIAKNARQHMADPEGVPLKSVDQIKKEVAAGVDVAFGGVNWFNMANDVAPAFARSLAVALNSPASRRLLQTFYIAPDWTVSALRLWTKGIAATLPTTSAKASDSLFRTILWGQVAMYGLIADQLAKQYAGHSLFSQDDWTYVDRGDGTKWQLDKHMMEGLHLIDNPTKFVLNKLNFPIKEPLEQMFGREYLTYQNGPGNISKLKSMVTGEKLPKGNGAYFGPPMTSNPFVKALRDFGLPLSAKAYQNNPDAVLSNMLGFPVYGKTFDQRIEDAGENAVQKRQERLDVGTDKEKARARTKSESQVRRDAETRARKRYDSQRQSQ